jgi:hypothetical protein
VQLILVTVEPPVAEIVEPPLLGLVDPPLLGLVDPPLPGLVDPPLLGLVDPPLLGLIEPPPLLGLVEPPLPGFVDPPLPGFVDPPSPMTPEPPLLGLVEPPLPGLFEPPSPTAAEPPLAADKGLEPPLLGFATVLDVPPDAVATRLGVPLTPVQAEMTIAPNDAPDADHPRVTNLEKAMDENELTLMKRPGKDRFELAASPRQQRFRPRVLIFHD